MTDLSGKVALVTGSARGIGKAIAIRYAQLGADIAINYFGDEAGASNTVAEIGEIGRGAIAAKADVTKPYEIERLFTETIGRFGKVDIVVANAGVELLDQALAEATEEQSTGCSRSIPRGRSSLCRRPPSTSQTTGGSSTSAPARPAIQCPGSACTGPARWLRAMWLASSRRRSAAAE